MLTEREKRMLACIREYRRLGNQTCREVCEVAAVHQEADHLLTLEPELDNQGERYDAPTRVEHRRFVDRVFARQRGERW